MLEQENANEDVKPHTHIDGANILNFTYYNILPHPSFCPSSQVERMGGGLVLFVKFMIAIPSLIMVLKLLPHLLSPCEKVGGAFFGLESLSNTSRFYKSYYFLKS